VQVRVVDARQHGAAGGVDDARAASASGGSSPVGADGEDAAGAHGERLRDAEPAVHHQHAPVEDDEVRGRPARRAGDAVAPAVGRGQGRRPGAAAAVSACRRLISVSLIRWLPTVVVDPGGSRACGPKRRPGGEHVCLHPNDMSRGSDTNDFAAGNPVCLAVAPAPHIVRIRMT
jgi:hypothetical protein